MPSTNGPVYQPTTVSYEPSRAGNGGGAMVESPLRVFHKPRPQVALLLFALLTLAAGLAMLASGLGNWLETKEFAEENAEDEPVDSIVEFPIGIVVAGVFMTCFGVVAVAVYLKYADWRRNCICPCPCPFFDKKQSLSRQLQIQNGGGGCNQGIMALNNPSTDPLVSHQQYVSITEMPEERRNLMPDNKECVSSAEESEVDPRIVLRPTSRVEDA